MRSTYQAMVLATGIALVGGCSSNGPNLEAPIFPFQTAQTTDTSTTMSVNDALMNNKSLAPFHLNVDSKNGMVILSGYVKTIKQSDTAGAIAAKVPGVTTVQNNIIVRK